MKNYLLKITCIQLNESPTETSSDEEEDDWYTFCPFF